MPDLLVTTFERLTEEESPCVMLALSDLERAAKIYRAARRIALRTAKSSEDYVVALSGLGADLESILVAAGLSEITPAMAEIAAQALEEGEGQ